MADGYRRVKCEGGHQRVHHEGPLQGCELRLQREGFQVQSMVSSHVASVSWLLRESAFADFSTLALRMRAAKNGTAAFKVAAFIPLFIACSAPSVWYYDPEGHSSITPVFSVLNQVRL